MMIILINNYDFNLLFFDSYENPIKQNNHSQVALKQQFLEFHRLNLSEE